MNDSSHIIKIEKQFTFYMNLFEKNIPIILLALWFIFMLLSFWATILVDSKENLNILSPASNNLIFW